jgi:hypothetical protein
MNSKYFKTTYRPKTKLGSVELGGCFHIFLVSMQLHPHNYYFITPSLLLATPALSRLAYYTS